MATYPPKLALPYRVGRSWLEQQILDGKAIAPISSREIAVDERSPELRERAAILAKRVDAHRFDGRATRTVEVVGSAIHPWARGIDPSGHELRPSDPVLRAIGCLPELSRPTDSDAALIEAYEQWIARYEEMSLQALSAWIERWALDGEPDEEGNAPNGAPVSWWIAEVTYELGGEQRVLSVDGRKDLELFHKLIGASQLRSHAETAAGEDATVLAGEVIGESLTLSAEPRSAEELIGAYADYVERLTDVAFARHWLRQRAREDHDQEMRRWAAAHGSRRLKLGLTDDYRMVPVYLRERIGMEVPGFYAHQGIKDREMWRLRKGPSEEALQLRRAVQTRLDETTRPGATVPTAEIGWMKHPPPAICDRRSAYKDEAEEELKESAFEIIGVRGWLTRYTLIAGVYSETEPLPDFILLKYVLRPKDYGLDGLLDPPEGTSIADAQLSRGAP